MRGRTSNRVRTALVGAAGVTAIVAGGAVAAVAGDGTGVASDVRLVQNATEGLVVGQQVDIDLKQVVEKRIGQSVPAGATLKLTGLPDGLKQDGWKLVGTPTKSGLYNVRVEVNALGQTSAQDVQLMVAAPQGQQPGGVITSPEASAPKTTTTSTTTPATTTSAADATDTTDAEATETSDVEAGDTETTETTDTDTSETTDTQVPTEDSGSLGGAGLGDLCDSTQLSAGIEQALPAVLGDGTDEGTANLIAGLLGSLLPSLIGTASADGGPCGEVAATGSIADGVGSLDLLGGGDSAAQGTEDGSVRVGPTEGDFNLQSVVQMVQLANGIMNQVGGGR